MDLNEKMAELDARIAARRDAIDKKLGITAEDGRQPESTEPAPGSFAGAPYPANKAAAPSGRDGGCPTKCHTVMDDLDAGLKIPGLFTIPGIAVKIVFVLLCLGAFLSLLWALRCLLHGWSYGVGWAIGDCLLDLFLAWGLWKVCTRN